MISEVCHQHKQARLMCIYYINTTHTMRKQARMTFIYRPQIFFFYFFQSNNFMETQPYIHTYIYICIFIYIPQVRFIAQKAHKWENKTRKLKDS